MKMVCYAVPLAAAVISTVVWFSQKRGSSGWWLNLMLYGAALFGVVDHLWYGELFLIGADPLKDLMAGAAITTAVFGAWGVTLGVTRIYPDLGHRMGFLRQNKKRAGV
ncbi:MAG: hypothetical protein AB1305_03695 [Candidatus Hadarchaeota archaeon]